VRLATSEPAPSGTALLTRTHPLTATLAEALMEASLDPESLSNLDDPCRSSQDTFQADRSCP
jgi:hypothetical protein